MKSICNLIFAALLFAMIFAVTELRAEDSQDSKIGLTVGIDYVSNYIYRGEYLYFAPSNAGMISPYISYNLFDTGLSVSIKGEVVEMWFWNERDELQQSDAFKMYNSIDYNVNYICEFNEIITFNVGGWYYVYQKCDFVGDGHAVDMSYFDIYFSARIDALPLTPRLIVTYSYYMDDDYARGYGSGGWGDGLGKNGDLYVQFGLGHSFELFSETYFDLEAIAGFYDKNSSGLPSLMATKGLRPTNSADISDIDLSAGFTTIAGTLTLYASLHYVIVPGTQYKRAYFNAFFGGPTVVTDIHRFYAKFGVSCSI